MKASDYTKEEDVKNLSRTLIEPYSETGDLHIVVNYLINFDYGVYLKQLVTLTHIH